MNLSWSQRNDVSRFDVTGSDKREYVVHFSECAGRDDEQIRGALNICVEKAISLLSINIHDDSMFLVFHWEAVLSELTVVVTNESKICDSKHAVKCLFSGLDSERLERLVQTGDEYAQQIKYWIKDYLTTCNSFLNYSLVAMFYSESRDACELL